MNDRVRIYELARQMNLPNQDLINALRELGYDVKSHSSTIEGATVGLLIAALGKKKSGEKPAAAPKAAKTQAKAQVPPPPPEPVVVKPRVLSRRKPGAEPIDTEPVQEVAPPPPAVVPEEKPEEEAPSPAPTPTRVPLYQTVDSPIGKVQRISQSADRPSYRPGEKPGQKPADKPGDKIAAKVSPDSTPETSKAQPEVIERPKSSESPDRSQQKIAAKTQPESPAQDGQDDSGKTKKPAILDLPSQSMRPNAPSVPIRVAAPSVRATPPRPPKQHRSSAPTERHLHQQKKDDKARQAAATIEKPKIVVLNQALSVKDLADKMAVSETEIIKRLFMKGFMRTVNQLVELELARDVAIEMEYEVLEEEFSTEEAKEEKVLSEEDKKALVIRPPVVTIMGHVDHGKTSLLDAIRQTKFLLTDAEAGGITQHIGAYHVEVPSEDGSMRQIVFLDTPGHEAFTAMRARGAKATDIAILVVAADDGVMPQTIEAIDHAKAAGVPMIVAVNKVDKAESDPDRVLSQLMEHDLVPDKYGGDTVTVSVSAKKRTGLEELLEMILLVADMQELKANPDAPASGVIIEAELSRGRGAVATALVQNGTLREGDYLVAGGAAGRVRALFDDRGARVKAAGPSMPVEVLGLDEVPQAGDRFEATEDIQAAKTIVESRRLIEQERRGHRVTLESLHDLLEQGEVKDLNVIVKADVQGTAEAIAEQVRKLTSKEVQVRVLRVSSGDISENDVNLAASSNAIIIGFNVQPDQNANKVRESSGVDIRTYNIIYQITDDLEMAIQGLIKPIREEIQIGTAEIRQVFKFGKGLSIAGCMVTSGKITRGAIVRVERGGQTVYDGKLDTLKRFKDDAKEVASGFECGMSFEKFNDFAEGDTVKAFTIQETKREPTR
jgi:translation initiation factor IF-2